MSTIGALNFDIMRGLPQLLKTRVDVWEVPGIDGYGAQTLGLGNADFELVTVAYAASSDDANSLIDAANALQGTIVEIEDDWGDDYTGMLVKMVDSKDGKRPCIHDGNLSAVRVEIRWMMCTT